MQWVIGAKTRRSMFWWSNDKGGELRTKEENGVTESPGLEVHEIAELSINSVVGLSAPKIMKVKG